MLLESQRGAFDPRMVEVLTHKLYHIAEHSSVTGLTQEAGQKKSKARMVEVASCIDRNMQLMI